MLIRIKKWDDVSERKLMDIYRESNTENADFFYPDMADKRNALRKTEQGFLKFIRSEFLDGKNCYMVLERDGIWVSALRLHWIKAGFYYMEALETHPDCRRMGNGSRLLSEVLNVLKKEGSFTVCDCVDKKNAASVSTHLKCGFVISNEVGYDYLQNETDDESYSMQFVYKEAP